MKREYEISLNMKTSKGIETYGYFCMGNSERFARYVYDMLEGEELMSSESVISIDLVKRENGFLFPLELRHCSCEQLAVNVKVITRELFKQLNLGD